MFALFKRHPRLFLKPKNDSQIVPQKMQDDFPDLEADFGVLEKRLMVDFRKLDDMALRAQNQFLWQQVLLIIGGVVTGTLGAVQAAMAGKARWPGITESTIAIALAAVAFIAKQTKSQKKYFSSRLKAERLRGEYFLFLGRLGAYDDDLSREQHLIRRVAEVVEEGA